MECICETKDRFDITIMLQNFLEGEAIFVYEGCCLRKMNKILDDFNLRPLEAEVILGNMLPEIIDMFLGQY